MVPNGMTLLHQQMGGRSSVLLSYGMRDGELVHISAVDAGLACRCSCPSCGAVLVARKGAELQHHFAHETVAECASWAETVAHMMGKQVLVSKRTMLLPPVYYSRHAPCMFPFITQHFDHVEEERVLGSIRPDIIAYARGVPLLIEIAVRHKVDAKKLETIRRLRISAVEVRVGAIEAGGIEELILRALDHKVWLFNTKAHDQARMARPLGDHKMSYVFARNRYGYIPD